MQELVDEERRDSNKETLMGQQDGKLQLQLHNVTISDEAWHVKRIADQDGRFAELQRYVNRVVQYLTSCILGQHSDQVLARIKGCKFSELLRRYDDCLKVMGWMDHNPFIDVLLIDALVCVFAQAGDEPIVDVAAAMHESLRVLETRGSPILRCVPLRRSSLLMRMQGYRQPGMTGAEWEHSCSITHSIEMFKN
jgi:hypothetical protein